MRKNTIKDLVVVVPLDEVMTCSEDNAAEEWLDSVGYWNKQGKDKHVMDLIHDSQRVYDSADVWRKSRDRAKRFTYGEQHGDKIKVDGKWMTEEDYIKSQGQIPMSNNLIRRLINNVVGTYINQDKEPTCSARAREEQKYGETHTTLLQYNRQLNKANMVYTSALQEALWGGFKMIRHYAGYNPDKKKDDVWMKGVEMNRAFIDADCRDVRGWDLKLIGELHDLSFADLCSKFAKGNTPKEVEMKVNFLKNEYAFCEKENYLNKLYTDFGYDRLENYDFLMPYRTGLCRVIEIWNRETKRRARCWDQGLGKVFVCDMSDVAEMVDNVNARRLAEAEAAGMDLTKQKIGLVQVKEVFIDQFWYYRFVTPNGTVLDEGESPYAHGEHPYSIFAYPFIDGEIHSFVDTFIDQQKYVNRLITMQDWIMKTSAKGVLLAPEGAFDGQDIDEIAEAWGRFDGVIVYKPKPGVEAPKQVSAHSTNIGIHELLATELKLFEDISGVNGALQGKAGYSATSGVLYAQQTQNATTSLMDILQSFSEFVIDGAYKTLKLILQYYPDEKIREVAGDDAAVQDFDVEKCRNIETDMSVVESTSTPAYRQTANAFLIEMAKLYPQMFDAEMLMELGDFPFADKALPKIQMMKQQATEAAQAQQMA